MTPYVIPIFISHQGCPHRCLFCDQHTISGRPAKAGQTGPGEIKKTIETWLARPHHHDRPVQVAFYGGSFTGLPEERQRSLLEAVRPFMDQGLVKTIRLSTRPDYVTDQTPAFLHNHGVTIVELGVQSMHDPVLVASGRGHTAAQATRAIDILKKSGLMVGVQLMLGLPGDHTNSLLTSIRKIIELQPDFVRLYPTLVIQGSRLADLYEKGTYRPLSLNRAVALAARARDLFDQRGIKIVRIGLQPSEELTAKVVAGPYHPAFGELVASRRLFQKARKILAHTPVDHCRELSIALADESAFRGPGNRNIKRLAGLGLATKMKLTFNPGQQRQTIDHTLIPC